jgi:hypothetical protein
VGGGVLRRGFLHGLKETAVELSAASMPEQGKRKARKSQLGRACKGKQGGPVGVTPHGGRRRTGPQLPAAAREHRRRALIGRREHRAGAGERGGACGPRVQAWADQGREGVGPGLRATVLILI